MSIKNKITENDKSAVSRFVFHSKGNSYLREIPDFIWEAVADSIAESEWEAHLNKLGFQRFWYVNSENAMFPIKLWRGTKEYPWLIELGADYCRYIVCNDFSDLLICLRDFVKPILGLYRLAN